MGDRTPRASEEGPDRRLRRRTVLAGTTGALGLLAGCADGGSDGSDGDDGDDGGGGYGGGSGNGGDDSDDGGGGDDGAGTTDDDATPSGDLDLREANVTAVAVESEGDGEYRFSVTLYHDDDGEDGYADRWVVERRDGTEIGRRELTHAHSTDPFTRSTSVAVPDGADCVVVRGHDQTHGYGGQAAVVVPGSGATDLVRQGSEPASFADRSCPE